MAAKTLASEDATGGATSIIEAAALQDRSTAVKSGYLRKKSRADRWQKRWFEAVAHYLAYYKTHESPKLLACIDLRQCGEIRVVPDGVVGASAAEFSIQLGERTYFLKAKTRADAQAWVETLVAIQVQTKPAAAPDDVRVEVAGGGAGDGVAKNGSRGCCFCC